MKSLSKFPSRKQAAFDPDYYGFDVREQVGLKTSYEGDVGIEIELEGRGLPQGYSGPTTNGVTWTYHNEGSLRGGGAEFVLSQPCRREDVTTLVDNLFETLRTSGATIRNSTRCSTHVHLNMRNAKLNQIASFVVLYGTFETLLTNWCEPIRRGNLFALRFEDCHYAVDGWVRAFREGDFSWPTEMRYLALNPEALRKFGSLEVRTLGGISSSEPIVKWVEALLRLRDEAFSVAYKDPRELAMILSGEGGRGFFDRVFRGTAIYDELVDANVNEDIEMVVRESFRRVQPILYALNWEHVLPEIERVYIPNPFGKPIKRKTVRVRMPEMRFAEPEPHFNEDDE